MSLNRYVERYTVGGIAGGRNPINRLANSTNRSWNDANRNYVPDCNLLDLNANGECGAVANRNFGSLVPETNYDEDILQGWGKRIYNWELTAGAQREIAAARLGRDHLLPPLVRQLQRHRQPRRHAPRTSTRSASPRRRIRGSPAAAAIRSRISTT